DVCSSDLLITNCDANACIDSNSPASNATNLIAFIVIPLQVTSFEYCTQYVRQKRRIRASCLFPATRLDWYRLYRINSGKYHASLRTYSSYYRQPYTSTARHNCASTVC